jgi:hypothetical protein
MAIGCPRTLSEKGKGAAVGTCLSQIEGWGMVGVVDVVCLEGYPKPKLRMRRDISPPMTANASRQTSFDRVSKFAGKL